MNIKGVDVSTYQSGLKIKDIKNAGYKFAILRGGFTGYGSDKTRCKDGAFDAFYSQAKALNFPIGVYYYSCATNTAEGREEAKFLYNNCLKGKQFEYPIYIDVENPQWQANNKEGVTDAILAFCGYLKTKGFYAGVYASAYWFREKINTSRLTDYTKWVAAWSDEKPTMNFIYDLWQNSDNGYIEGQRIDTNRAFKDFPEFIKNNGYNGYIKPVEPAKKKSKKSISTLAKEVIAGKWGNGIARKNKLIKAGYDYNKVQAEVNKILGNIGDDKPKEYYTVKKGDNLTRIAQKYNTTVADLVKLNRIEDKNLIYAGQKLRVK